ncbi:MAG: restriction endonuclease [Faecalibacterium sp.]
MADDLLAEVLNQTPAFFEQLVVDLMKAMNYGEGFVTKYSGDDGIDGIIHEDQLGFNLIYIQASVETGCYHRQTRTAKFAGAMMGLPRVEKGLFITTAKFSPKARDFANAQHIILVDGKRLTELMIEYGVGVSTQKAYLIKRVDSDYFSDN